MNPIFATGLVNLGKDFLSSGVKLFSQENLTSVDKKSFALKLQSAKDQQGLIPQNRNLDHLSKELLNDPELRKFISQNEGHTLQLDKSANGTFRILSSSGDLFVINQSSPCIHLAQAYHNACLSKGQNLVPSDPSKVLIPT